MVEHEVRDRPLLWRWHVGALVIYAGLAVVFIDHGVSLTRNILGRGSDPSAFIWLLAWWPWAISHHLDPLYTNLVWQPLGVPLAWVASLPLLSLAGLPFTLLSGPVLTFNIFILLAPALSAWVAYRLCLRLTAQPAAALIGGYLFGFSSYGLGQDYASLNLSMSVFVPALLLLILMRLDNELSRFKTILLATLILVCQFLTGIEIFSSIFLFGGIAWLLALLYMPERRGVLRRLMVDGLMTAPFVIILISPFLMSMLSHAGYVKIPSAWPYYFAADLFNYVAPSSVDVFGGRLFPHLAAHFYGDMQEQNAYLGLPQILIIILFAKANRSILARRYMLSMLLIMIVASLGPVLWIGGYHSPVVLPWEIFVHLPLISSALPCRFGLFVALLAAIITAMWIAGPAAAQTRRWRVALGALACLALMPKLHPYMKLPHSSFFRPGEVEAVLGQNARVLILPFAINGPSSFWQAESRFSFAQTGGYLGFPPAAMQHYAAVGQLFGNAPAPDFLNDFAIFCHSTNTQYVVAGPGTSAAMLAYLDQLNWPMRNVDDVTVFTVPLSPGNLPLKSRGAG